MNLFRRSLLRLLLILACSGMAYGQQSSSVPLGETPHFDCNTFNSSGAPSAADSTPTFNVYEEATDTAIINGTSLAARTGHTGEYRGTFVASSGNGFEVGKWYIVKCYATVGGLDGKQNAMHFRVTAAENVEGTAVVDVNLYRGSTPNVLTSGRPDVSIGAVATNAMTGAGLAADAITKLQTGILTVQKNVAFSNYPIKLVDSLNAAWTGGTSSSITCTRSINGAAFAACSAGAQSSITEIGQGYYYANLAASDTNGNVIIFRFTSSTGGVKPWESISTPQR
jgi:hypothetical protein